MLGELTAAGISNIAGSPWQASYNYHPDGDLASRQINADPAETFTIDGDYLTGIVDGASFEWDNNGNMVTGLTAEITWNWDRRLRHADLGAIAISYYVGRLGDKVNGVEEHDPIILWVIGVDAAMGTGVWGMGRD